MNAVEEESMVINGEDRTEKVVHSGGQNGDSQIITKSDGGAFKRADRRTFEEMCRKRKKHRRGKPKKKLWLLKKDQSEKDGGNAQIASKRRKANIFVQKQPAPNNTTQFIMEDHTDLQLQEFNVHCNAAAEKANVGPGETADRTGRARDSSFSVDSNDEFYSSPEDEEEFLTKEFSNTYEDVHVERLGTMSKTELIEEYLQLEKRVDNLEKKLKSSQSSRTRDQGSGVTGNESDGEVGSGELRMEPDTAEKIRIFQEEINKLIVANQELMKENNRLRAGSATGPTSPFSSVDSESDSSSSSSESSRSSSSSGSVKSKVSQASGVCESKPSSPNALVEEKASDVIVVEEKVDVSDVHASDSIDHEPLVNGVTKSDDEVEGGKQNA